MIDIKRLFVAIIVSTSLLVGCAGVHKYNKTFEYIGTQGLTYDGTDIYCDGVRCAELSAIEIAYDDGKIVTEITFVLLSSEYNDKALSIIKFVMDRRPGYEVEVELKAQ